MSARSAARSSNAANAAEREPGQGCARQPPARAALRTLSMVVALAAGLAACGGGGGRSNPAGPVAPATTAAAGAARSARCPAAARFGGRVNDHGATAAASSQLQIQAGDTFFAPTCQTQVPAGTVTLVVHNTGRILHNLTIPGQHIDADIPAGQTITVQVKIGTTPVTYFCKYHRAAGMLGALLPNPG